MHIGQTVRKRLWLAAWTLLVSAPLLVMAALPMPGRGDADASRGFHAGQEAVRLLSEAIDMARTGEGSARQTTQTGTDIP